MTHDDFKLTKNTYERRAHEVVNTQDTEWEKEELVRKVERDIEFVVSNPDMYDISVQVKNIIRNILTTKDAECFCKNKGFAELIEGSKARWLRSEIEKLEVDKAEQEQLHDQNENCHPTDCEHRAIDSYIDSIITRYKEELEVLESK